MKMNWLDLVLLGVAFFALIDATEARGQLRRVGRRRRASLFQAQLAVTDTPLSDDYYGPVTLTAPTPLYDQDQEES